MEGCGWWNHEHRLEWPTSVLTTKKCVDSLGLHCFFLVNCYMNNESYSSESAVTSHLSSVVRPISSRDGLIRCSFGETTYKSKIGFFICQSQVMTLADVIQRQSCTSDTIKQIN